MAYNVTAALVIVPDDSGAFHHFYREAVIGDGFDKDRLKVLAKEGMLEKVEEPKPDTSDRVEDILAAVGNDKAKAAEALDQEKAGKNRSTLIGKLEAIVNG